MPQPARRSHASLCSVQSCLPTRAGTVREVQYPGDKRCGGGGVLAEAFFDLEGSQISSGDRERAAGGSTRRASERHARAHARSRGALASCAEGMLAYRHRSPCLAAVTVARSCAVLPRATGFALGALAPRQQVRFVGEPTGLRAGPSGGTTSNLHRHDTLGLVAGVGQTVVDSYASWGFVVNGVALDGAVLLLPSASLLFEPRSLSEVTPESLAVLSLLDTPTRMLVLGCGRQSRRAPSALRRWCAQRDIAIEALSTQHAASTFNFMVAEDRPVAAVLFPLDVDD